jgi:hypothetical protein
MIVFRFVEKKKSRWGHHLIIAQVSVKRGSYIFYDSVGVVQKNGQVMRIE